MKPAALLPSLLVPTVLALVGACGSDKPTGWWQQDDACPEGSEVEKTASEIYCATETGTRNGRYNRLDGNASLLISGAYADGVPDGTWAHHGKDGAVVDSFEVREGSGTIKTWRDDGSLESEHQLVGGERHGSFVAWSTGTSGSPIKLQEGRFEKTVKAGTWIHRNDKNEIVREIDYRDGDVWTTRHFESGNVARTELSEKAKAKAEADALAKSEDQLRAAGVLGALAQQGGAFASLTGTSAFSSGLDDKDVYGGLLGNEVGEMQGGFGYGASGAGPGGGGTGWGTIGTGGLGTIGKGSGTSKGSGTGAGYGKGSGRIGTGGGGYGSSSGGAVKRRTVTPRIRIGTSTVNGDLDKNIIRRYIRRKQRQLRFCYERELLNAPTLKGSVVTSFTIAPSGKVVQSTAKGMGNKKVESCVKRVISTIVFPKPKNGGTVKVRYPFVFSSK